MKKTIASLTIATAILSSVAVSAEETTRTTSTTVTNVASTTVSQPTTAATSEIPEEPVTTETPVVTTSLNANEPNIIASTEPVKTINKLEDEEKPQPAPAEDVKPLEDMLKNGVTTIEKVRLVPIMTIYVVGEDLALGQEKELEPGKQGTVAEFHNTRMENGVAVETWVEEEVVTEMQPRFVAVNMHDSRLPKPIDNTVVIDDPKSNKGQGALTRTTEEQTQTTQATVSQTEPTVVSTSPSVKTTSTDVTSVTPAKTNSATLPATGEKSNSYLTIFGMLFAAVGTLMFWNKKKEEA